MNPPLFHRWVRNSLVLDFAAGKVAIAENRTQAHNLLATRENVLACSVSADSVGYCRRLPLLLRKGVVVRSHDRPKKHAFPYVYTTIFASDYYLTP